MNKFAKSHAIHTEKKIETLGIDFTFNTIKNVKKVAWKDEAPWYREILDGFCWLGYCHNERMKSYLYIKSEMRARFGPNGDTRMEVEDF